MRNRKRWVIIIVTALILFGFMPRHDWRSTVWVSDTFGQIIMDSSDGDLSAQTTDQMTPGWVYTDFDRFDFHAIQAMLWSSYFRWNPDGIQRWRFSFPGCCLDEWWQLAMYVPSLWIDYGMFNEGELTVFFKPVPHGRFDLTGGFVHGHTFGWSNQSGWYCNFCEEE